MPTFNTMGKNKMRTDKELLIKGLKQIGYTILLMFGAPVVIYQAFKNEGHPFYWPVLIVGFALAILAIGMGFYSIKTIMDALFGNNKPRQGKPKKHS